MNKLVLAASTKSVINKDMLTPRQFQNIGLAQKKFNEMFANTNYHAEIVTTANKDIDNLVTLEDASNSQHAGYYANGAVKIWIATDWIEDDDVYPDSPSKKIFTSEDGNPTPHISIGTFLDLKRKDLY